MAIFSQFRDAVDIEDEVASLRKEVAALTRSLSKHGAAAYRGTRDEATDLYGELADRFVSALPAIRKRAHNIEHTIRDNPTQTVAMVGLAALCITAAVMFSRR